MHAEIRAADQRDARLVEQRVGELLRLPAGLRDVREGVEGALRGDAGDARQRVRAPSTTTLRRWSNAATIFVDSSCGPVRAAMPANCVGALTQDQQLTASFRTLS